MVRGENDAEKGNIETSDHLNRLSHNLTFMLNPSRALAALPSQTMRRLMHPSHIALEASLRPDRRRRLRHYTIASYHIRAHFISVTGKIPTPETSRQSIDRSIDRSIDVVSFGTKGIVIHCQHCALATRPGHPQDRINGTAPPYRSCTITPGAR